MDNYIPPFDITNIMLDRISSIMKKIGKLENYKNLNKMPVLRRNNRIRSIHSSLAIEANSLSFDQVKDIIDGKKVIGPQDEIQEVKNAYEAYKLIKEVNQYSIKDLKKVHGVMTYLTVDESGEFRKGNEGVFDENGNCIHVCPPPEQVNELMKQLFKWMEDNNGMIHPLILSSVFHYEFVFIHPFKDGNGRTARILHNIKFTEMINKLYGTRLKLSPLNISESILINKITYVKRIDNIYFDIKHDSNIEINAWFNFILDMIDEQLYKAMNKLEKIDSSFVIEDVPTSNMRLSRLKHR